jgi:hypothetical protein
LFLKQGMIVNDSFNLWRKLIKSTTKDEIIIIFVQVKQGNQALQGKARGGSKDFQVKIDASSLFRISKVDNWS